MSNKISKLTRTKVKKEKTSQEKDQTKSQLQELLKEKNISVAPNQIDLLVQIFKFIIVGGIATLIDWVIYFILYKIVKLNPLYANIISFSISVIYNYIASCKYVFKVDTSKSKSRRFIEFITFALIGLLINELLIFGLVTKLKWNAMLVKIIATAIVMVFNFVTRKKFLEKNN